MNGEIRVVVHAADPGDGRPGHLRAVGRPAPGIGPGQVLVEVHAALLDPAAAPPREDGTVVGNEAAGVITEVGPDVTDLVAGDGVVLPTLLSCGRCPLCRAGRENLCRSARRPAHDTDGWLAEQVAVAAHLLIPRPPTVPAALAASVPGVVATAYHALKRAGIGPGVSVAVVGADALGLHLTQLAALAGGAVTVLDDRDATRTRAEDLGADAALPTNGAPPAAVLPEPVDRVLVTPGHSTSAAEAVAALNPGGRVVLVDLRDDVAGALPTSQLIRDELDVVGASGATHAEAMELFDLAAEGRLVLHTAVTATSPIDELTQVEAEAAAGATEGLRIAVDPRPRPPTG